MRLLFTITLCAALAGCMTPSSGPGSACDPCAEAEAQPYAAPGGTAAAAAAKGGQEANQAPFSNDTARLQPQVTVGRGQGATTSSSADQEQRHVVSGGASNNSIITPALANAAAGGGVSPALSEAAQDVQAARASYIAATCDPTVTTERLQFYATQWAEARKALAAAQSACQSRQDTIYNMQGARFSQMTLSTSSTDGKPSPEAVAAAAKAGGEIGTAAFADELYEEVTSETSSSPPAAPSTFPPAPAAPESLPSPPAGPVGSPDGTR